MGLANLLFLTDIWIFNGFRPFFFLGQESERYVDK